jgi:hypothetical protein
MAHTNDRAGLAKPLTLAIDIGGSDLKATVLNASGMLPTDPVRRRCHVVESAGSSGFTAEIMRRRRLRATPAWRRP